ncbi:hypothetical protein B0H13DRAFT_2134198, partial [Mycena leptocephala]
MVTRSLSAPRATTSILAPCPSKAPAWFVDARAQVTAVNLGCHFHTLLAAWTCVEAASRFEHGPTNLSSKLCPSEVSVWVSNQRGKRGEEPRVTDACAYAKRWQPWWDSLQLDWRTKGKDGW